jgi:hypothetical protein
MFAIYNNPTAVANVAAGTGFQAGTLVAAGSINPGALTIFSGTGSNQGLGSTELTGLVGYANASYLNPAIQIFDFDFQAQINAPTVEGTTTSFFDGVNGFAVTPLGGNQGFDVDGSSNFSVVPEPSTLLLLGIGLLGMTGYIRKKRMS